MTLARALELRARCDYRGALDALAAADDVASLLERSRLHEDFGEYGEAEADAAAAVAAAADSLLFATATARLAGAMRAQRRALEAERLLLQVAGPEAAFERAAALEELGRFDEAAELLHANEPADARSSFARRLGLGNVARGRGRYEEAERELRAAITEAEGSFGASAVETAAALNALGMVFKYSARFDESRELYCRALAIVTVRVGEHHPDVASIYHNLGGLEHARGDYARAEKYARRSVEVRRRAEHPDDVSAAEDDAALASILHSLGRDEEAESLLRGAVAVLERALGPDHAEVAAVWHNLASVAQRRGDLAGADAAYGRALAAKERTLGPEHPLVAITLNNQAVNARKQGDRERAAALYRRALSILEGRVRADHPHLVLTRRNYARLLGEAGLEDTRVSGRLERTATQQDEEGTMAPDEFEAHRLAGNTNEEGLGEDGQVTPEKLAANTNEDALIDDDVEGHRLSVNTNEGAEPDEADAERSRLAANTNEELVADDD